MKSALDNNIAGVEKCKKGFRKNLVAKIIDSRFTNNSPTLQREPV
jgi:hypothetical protein